VAGVPNRRQVLLATAATLCASPSTIAQPRDDNTLRSWNDGLAKQAIADFVRRVCAEGTPDYVAPAERIAVFDNDGTLWAEQPTYFQAMFLADRVRALGAKQTELLSRQPFKALIEGDRAALLRLGEHGIAELLAATHSGMTTDEFAGMAAHWLATARHPRFDRPYTELIYQPMLELLALLRANRFKTFIVSGGGIDFIRVFSERVYGIPPEQVIGSSGQTRFEIRGEQAVLVKLPKLGSSDDKEGKPVNINLHIGRRPILAFGNSDGDLAMLQWTASAAGPAARFMGLVHHTDSEREYAYDRTSHIGRLDAALDAANARGWVLVDMQRDWNQIFPR
jgi:phosphoglycolate phosphatase-like HAD superfamily hydrolase